MDATAMVQGEVAHFELKKSKYSSTRASDQLAAQIFCLGMGTYGAETLNVIYSEDQCIEVFTRKDAKLAVDAVLNGKGDFIAPEP